MARLKGTAAACGLAATMVLAACAGPPATAVAEFGTSAKKTVDLIGEVRATGYALDDAVAAEDGAKIFLASARVDLRPPSTCLADRAGWDDQGFAPRVRAFEAVAAYADALSKATDSAAVEKIKSAASAVVMAAAPGGGAAAPVVGAAAGFAIEAATAAHVRGIMRRVHPALVAVVAQFSESDLPVLTGLYRACLKRWVALRRSNLAAVGPRNADALDFYLRSVAEARALDARVTALENAEVILTAFVAAHAKLIESDADIATIVAQFDGFADVIGAAAKATDNPEGQ